MNICSFFSLTVQSTLLTAVVLGSLLVVQADARSSPNYALESDSINFAGGLSTSSQFSLESTAGEIATGNGESASYSLRAGYQQMQAVFLSITAAANVEMAPALLGLTGGFANGSTSVTVLTDSPAGYELTIAATQSPAMVRGPEAIPDYISGAAPLPDLAFTLGSAPAYFGFSPEGSDIVTRFRDNGTTCGVGALDTLSACWLGLSTTPIVIASGGANQPNGTPTLLRFRVGLSPNASVLAGDYIATTTITALPL